MYLNCKEIAKKYRFTTNYVRVLVNKYKIPHIRTKKGLWRILVLDREISKFLKTYPRKNKVRGGVRRDKG